MHVIIFVTRVITDHHYEGDDYHDHLCDKSDHHSEDDDYHDHPCDKSDHHYEYDDYHEHLSDKSDFQRSCRGSRPER